MALKRTKIVVNNAHKWGGVVIGLYVNTGENVKILFYSKLCNAPLHDKSLFCI